MRARGERVLVLAQDSPSSSGPLNVRPSGSAPEASTGNLPSSVRQAPTASKFSSPKPSGSIRTWQAAQVALVR